MRSHTRYVVVIVALLTAFSLFTIVRNKPTPNYQVEPDEITSPYDEEEEMKFLQQDHEEPGPNYDIIGNGSHLPLPDLDGQQNGIDMGLVTHLMDVLDRPDQVEKFNFQSCRMSNCFDYSRCNHNEALKVHILSNPVRNEPDVLNITGESNIIHRNILKVIRGSKYFEPDAEKACLFVLEDDTLDRDTLSSSFRPGVQDVFQAKYGFGMNYLIFNLYSGSWPDYREDDFSGLKIGAAILAKASNSQSHHRTGFDVSIPLFSYLHPAHDTNQGDEAATEMPSPTTQSNKSYFLTFKGKRYIIGSGSDTRNSLYHLNNQRDVVMLTTCKHGKKWRDIKDARCADQEVSYNQFDFVDLMRNSTFCLTPRGRRLGSFRFLEALNYGCIPVILSDGWVWPFNGTIDWSDAAIQFPEDQILLVPDQLRDIGHEQIVKMRQKCEQLYRKYFSSIEKIVLTTLEIIETRLRNK